MNEAPKILSTNLFPVVGIGASAGGLEAFRKLIQAIPHNSGMAYVLVQHLDPKHESLLPELLQKATTLPVVEISDDIKVLPDHIYVLPSNKTMVANDGVLILAPRQVGKNIRNLPIDLFFTSLAEVHQDHAIGVVLSGTASDGTEGLRSIKEYGGTTFAQDEASAAFSGMPRSAALAGVVDYILPPEEIPEKLIEINKSVYDNEQNSVDNNINEGIYKKIISLVRFRKGVDFSYYKQPSIKRRINRRILITKHENIADYFTFLSKNVHEQDALYQDIIIPVTAFFRDTEIFQKLCQNILPAISKNKNTFEPIRIWVAGCSTGQEAYSMAICLTEFLHNSLATFQIFATDISEQAIVTARLGTYNLADLGNVSEERLKTFFTKKDNCYQISKELREKCVFAVHNFLKDPPFSKMDIVSCRNVFIYMEPYLQKKALTTFHFSLNPNGLLWLGKTESINSVPNLFTHSSSMDKNDRFFNRKETTSNFSQATGQRPFQQATYVNTIPRITTTNVDFRKTADDILLNQYTPASVVVNDAMDIVYFRGATSKYLEQGAGKPSHNLIQMAKEGLAFELRNLLHKSKKNKTREKKDDIILTINGDQINVSIEAIPLPNMPEPHYLLLFYQSVYDEVHLPIEKRRNNTKKDEKDIRIAQLEAYQQQQTIDIQSIIEEAETVNQDLQSANEELLSSSEELQSLNEELETSKEELQSINEELTVVNQEMLTLNEQLTISRDFAEAIIDTISEPLLVLESNYHVKSANNAFYQKFKVTKEATEGHLIYELGNRQWDISKLQILMEKLLPEKSKVTDFEITHNFPNIGIRTILLNASKLIRKTETDNLILVTFMDITETREHQQVLEELLNRFQNQVMQAPVSICIIRKAGYEVELANTAFLKMVEKNQSFINKPFFISLPEMKTQGFKEILETVFQTGQPFYAHEMEVFFKRCTQKERFYFNIAFQPLMEKDKNVYGLMAIFVDITAQVISRKKIGDIQQIHTTELEHKIEKGSEKLSEVNKMLLQKNEELQKTNKELESFTYITSHDLQEPLRKIKIYTSLLVDQESFNLSEKSKDYFSRIQQSADRMRTLIQDLLTYSHTESADRKLIKTDLKKIIEEVKSDLSELIAEKGAVIKIGKLVRADVNVFQFRQVFNNLVNNSLKFSLPGISPRITIKSSFAKGLQLQNENPALAVGRLKAQQEYCHISFSDNGIGFAPEYNEQIFGVFQRLHNRDAFTGSGIGLSIVKKIVENHNGIIIASGKLNKGATFQIYIPRL